MILKIIGLVFGYMLCGIGTLELLKLHDRHSDWKSGFIHGLADVQEKVIQQKIDKLKGE